MEMVHPVFRTLQKEGYPMPNPALVVLGLCIIASAAVHRSVRFSFEGMDMLGRWIFPTDIFHPSKVPKEETD